MCPSKLIAVNSTNLRWFISSTEKFLMQIRQHAGGDVDSKVLRSATRQRAKQRRIGISEPPMYSGNGGGTCRLPMDNKRMVTNAPGELEQTTRQTTGGIDNYPKIVNN